MGSEVFKLKSLSIEETVVRGARVNTKNDPKTSPLLVNPNPDMDTDAPVLTGEVGVNENYLIQASLAANDFDGYGTFQNGSVIVTGYTGPAVPVYSDIFRLNSDGTFYTVTGAQGTDVYLTSKFTKHVQSDPDIQSGPVTHRRVKLESVRFEQARATPEQGNITYEDKKTDWGLTGLQFAGSQIAETGLMFFDTGMNILFQPSSDSTAYDLTTVKNINKVVVNNNTTEISDVALTPVPYPGDSLTVYLQQANGPVKRLVEYVDYVVNYSQNPEFKFPPPPYAQRKSAYIRFLDLLNEETQVPSIDQNFGGAFSINKTITMPGGGTAVKPITNIIPTTDMVSVGSTEKERNFEYVIDDAAGMVATVQHENKESLMDALSYSKQLMWDGVSVIRGVTADKVKDMSKLVIPPISGIGGDTGLVYFEDADDNNLVKNVDYVIEYHSGAMTFLTPPSVTDKILVSYYVEGEDQENEQISVNRLRTAKFPVIVDSLTLNKRYTRTADDGTVQTGTRVMTEGEDFEFSYTTGVIKLLPDTHLNEETLAITATYTPMAQMNCILQVIPGDKIKSTMTIVDDALKIVDLQNLVFQVNNPAVSVLQTDPFKNDRDPAKYTYEGSILPGNLLSVKVKERSTDVYKVEGFTYADSSKDVAKIAAASSKAQDINVDKILQLNPFINENRPGATDTVVATYSFISEVLPYAPLLIFFPILAKGSSSFVIEGFDRTDMLRKESLLRIDNFDPEATYFFKIKNVTYANNSTLVELYGSFSQDIRNPTFYVFDDLMDWETLPSGTVVDTSVIPGSQAIVLRGPLLALREAIRSNELLNIGSKDIYQVTAVTFKNDMCIVGLFPKLINPISSDITYTRYPSYGIGDTILATFYRPITTPEEPAFRLSYVMPGGLEGSATITIDKKNIVLIETIGSTTNPVPYVYRMRDYGSVYDLAKTIQATPSTYKQNVPFSETVPDYNPFTISPAEGEEDYFLSGKSYSPDLIIPFATSTPADLPYTLTILPELSTYKLIQMFKGGNSFLIRNAQVLDLFPVGSVIAVKDCFGGVGYFHEVLAAGTVVDDVNPAITNTKVTIKDTFRADFLNPYIYRRDATTWTDVQNKIVTFDIPGSAITIDKEISTNLKRGSLIKLQNKYLFYVTDIAVSGAYHILTLSPGMTESMIKGGFLGTFKHTTLPAFFDDVQDQPTLNISYTTPKSHTGYVTYKITASSLFLKETVDNLKVKTTEFKFSDYANVLKLGDAVIALGSVISGKKPFTVDIPQKDNLEVGGFNTFALKPTGDAYISLSPIVITEADFSVSYTVPVGHTGIGEMKLSGSILEFVETVLDDPHNPIKKSTSISYRSDTASLRNLQESFIPAVESHFTGFYPFSTVKQVTSSIGLGSWDGTDLVSFQEGYTGLPQNIYAQMNSQGWMPLENINTKRLELGTDYTLDTGNVVLKKPLETRDRFLFNYMGLDPLVADAGKAVKCSCRYFSTLPAGSNLSVIFDYQNIDQFFLQKLTERKFSEIVVIPQIKDILKKLGNGGGQGADNGSDQSSTPPYAGGTVNMYYLLRDEEIKKLLYMKFFQWYKERLRGFAAEMQLTMGFKFGHSTALGNDNSGNYSLDDSVVEGTDYTLTRASDFEQIRRGFSRFFPVGYNKVAPFYFQRFSAEYLFPGTVSCQDVMFTDGANNVKTQGIIKAKHPCWTRQTDVEYKIWQDAYIKEELVASYSVPISVGERTLTPSEFSWLKTVNIGDQIKISGQSSYKTITNVVAISGSDYEYLVIDGGLNASGLPVYDLRTLKDKDGNPVAYDTLVANLPPDGFNVYIKRTVPEKFPMFDDNASLGATIVGGDIPGNKKHSNDIEKFSLADLLALLFPFVNIAPHKKFKIKVKKDPEAQWEDYVSNTDTHSIDLRRLDFFQERNVDTVRKALAYDFTLNFVVPPFPPFTLPSYLYRVERKDDQGFWRDFDITFEPVYDVNEEDGYKERLIIRCKDRNWSVRVENDSSSGLDETGLPPANSVPVVGDYGFSDGAPYYNFYDPENIYRKLLLEKQAWQTEQLIIQDLFDHSDKLARGFQDGDLSVINSRYRGYLAGSGTGISDLLKNLILSYEKQLAFLVSSNGPLYRVLKPDGIHDENNATPAIAMSYNQTTDALSLYSGFYSKSVDFRNLNNQNYITWLNQYVRWCLDIQIGLMYQKYARQQYESNNGVLTIGVQEFSALKIQALVGPVYKVKEATVIVTADNWGKILEIYYKLQSIADPNIVIDNLSPIGVPLYRLDQLGGVAYAAYKTFDEICTGFNSLSHEGVHYFTASNVFAYHENGDSKNTVYVSVSLDLTNGTILNVTNIEDHRSKYTEGTTVLYESDPRVLFLNRSVEDRIYTQDDRELNGLTLTYNGGVYQQIAGFMLIEPYGLDANITVEKKTSWKNLSFGVFFNELYQKVFSVKGTCVQWTAGDYPVPEESEMIRSYPLWSDSDGRYKTVAELMTDIKNDMSSGIYSPWPFLYINATVKDTSKSTENMETSADWVPVLSVGAFYFSLSTVATFTVKDDHGTFSVFHDTDAHKKLKIVFDNVPVNDVIYDGAIFTFDMQKSGGTYKTLQEFSAEVSEFRYKNKYIFTLTVLPMTIPGAAESVTSCLYIVTAQSDTVSPTIQGIIKVDPYLNVLTVQQDSPLSNANVQNAYYSFPFYTANGNPKKAAIENIPVSGTWDTTRSYDVLELSCVDGSQWEISFVDYANGKVKYFGIDPTILAAIDSPAHEITPEQYTALTASPPVTNKPLVTILEYLQVTRIGATKNVTIDKPDQTTVGGGINLRQFDTIQKLADYINSVRFDDNGNQSVSGTNKYFDAKVLGDASQTGKFKSYEIHAEYEKIVRDFYVISSAGATGLQGATYYQDKDLGWQLMPISLAGDEKNTFTVEAQRYSPDSTFKFSMNNPEVARRVTLTQYPQLFLTNAFTSDILAFRIFCWDDANAHAQRYFQVSNNWIYFKSAAVDYNPAVGIDLGQPDPSLGYGIPLAGSGHPLAPDNESLIDLMNRINNNAYVNQYFYADLGFTRSDVENPGYFEYSYLPNQKYDVDKSRLDSYYLRDEVAVDMTAGGQYGITSSLYSYVRATNLFNMSVDWSYTYSYLKEFEFGSSPYDTVNGLVTAINNEYAPEIVGPLFVATASVGHESESTIFTPTFDYRKEIDFTLLSNKTVQGLVDFINGDLFPTNVPSPIFQAQAIAGHETENILMTPPYGYSKAYPTNNFSYQTISDLVTAINNDVAPGFTQSVFETSIEGTHGGDLTSTLMTVFAPVYMGTSFIPLYNADGAHVMNIRLRNAGGTDFTISFANYTVVRTTTKILNLSCTIYYRGLEQVSVQTVDDLTYKQLMDTFSVAVLNLKVRPVVGNGYTVTNATYQIAPLSNKLTLVCTIAYTGLKKASGTLSTTSTDIKNTLDQIAMTLKLNVTLGTGFTIPSASFSIPTGANKIVLNCTIVYSGTYTVVNYSTSTDTVTTFKDYLNSLRPHTSSIFGPLLSASLTNDFYAGMSANLLQDSTGKIFGATFVIDLSKVAGLRILNMDDTVSVGVHGDVLSVGTVTEKLPVDKDLYTWIDEIRGDLRKGLLSIDQLPMKVPDITYGTLRELTPVMQKGNPGTNVYFGILGDFKFLQISDFNLHEQMNHIKDRLALPWTGYPDYYTKENYNVNNPYAIDTNNMLGYMRSVRYNQIKSSVLNEALVQNKYFWIYMKLHRETGCDQLAQTYRGLIENKQTDLSQMGSIQ